MFVIIASLAGCSGLSLPTASLEQPPSGASGPRWSLVALQGISGASPAFTQQLTRQLNSRAQTDAIALLVDPALNADVRLEGMLSLSRDKDKDGKSALRYVWIIRDGKGVAVQTFEGAEAVKLPLIGQDPWTWVPASAIEAMADRAVGALAPHLRPSDIVSATVAPGPKSP